MSSPSSSSQLTQLLRTRFGPTSKLDPCISSATLESIAARGSCRHFDNRAIDETLIRTLCSVSMCAPSKSDLQQRDIIIIKDPNIRKELDILLSEGPLGQSWVPAAPQLLVFCGNNRRLRQIHEWRNKPFANDHLDAFFNASVDAGIAMTTFIHAAESLGLGCCPISAIRNEAEQVSTLLHLPNHVFPVVGLAVGWPVADLPTISMRLPLEATVHTDRFSEASIQEHVDAYDLARHTHRPYKSKRYEGEYGDVASDEIYGWSEDKARQYSKPERAGFGSFIKKIGFKLC